MDAEITTAREFWDRKVHKTIQMYEYGAFTDEKFISELSTLGYDEDDAIDAIDALNDNGDDDD
jgi:hypothetical protein|tara:strand:- start:34 stop:222 length:189 start_codon:yes stop_codon:yes gene_type:complete